MCWVQHEKEKVKQVQSMTDIDIEYHQRWGLNTVDYFNVI